MFVTDGGEAVVTVHTPMRGPGRAGGPPAHTNDYDELWFLHTAEPVPGAERVGKLRWEPQGLTQAGFKRSNGDAPRRQMDVPSMNVNVDVRQRLHLTKEALEYVREHQAAVAFVS